MELFLCSAIDFAASPFWVYYWFWWRGHNAIFHVADRLIKAIQKNISAAIAHGGHITRNIFKTDISLLVEKIFLLH